MADISADLVYEVLKSIQTRLAGMDGKLDELKQEMQALQRLDCIELADAPSL